MKRIPPTNYKSINPLWFDQDRGFIFYNDFVAGFECSFSYNLLYGSIGWIVANSIKQSFEPQSESEMLIFLQYNKETHNITGRYVTKKPWALDEHSEHLFHKIEDKFNESIRDLNCGYSIEF